MKDLICDEFQNTVSELLIRHHSILKMFYRNSRKPVPVPTEPQLKLLLIAAVSA